MKTKRIDFNIDLARKIQAGEAQGRIVTRDGNPVRVICWDKECFGSDNQPIVALLRYAIGSKGEFCRLYTDKGKSIGENFSDLFLEVPDDTPQFKPYDKVLVRDNPYEKWRCSFFSHYDKDDNTFPYQCVGIQFTHCIPYEGNEHLVGTTDEPKEGGAE